MSRPVGTNDDPIMPEADLAEALNCSDLGAKLEAAKALAVRAILAGCTKGFSLKTIRASEVLFRWGETAAEKQMGLDLLIKHLSTSRVDIMAEAAKVIKKSSRRTAMASAMIGRDLAEVRKQRLAKAV